jgi:hypothetical protein
LFKPNSFDCPDLKIPQASRTEAALSPKGRCADSRGESEATNVAVKKPPNFLQNYTFTFNKSQILSDITFYVAILAVGST